MLPVVPGDECVDALRKAGFREVRRARDNHTIMRRDAPFAQVSVPDHRVLDRGTLRAIIRQAGLSVDEFRALL